MNEAFVESRKIMKKLEWTLPKEKDASCITTTSYLLFIFFSCTLGCYLQLLGTSKTYSHVEYCVTKEQRYDCT